MGFDILGVLKSKVCGVDCGFKTRGLLWSGSGDMNRRKERGGTGLKGGGTRLNDGSGVVIRCCSRDRLKRGGGVYAVRGKTRAE